MNTILFILISLATNCLAMDWNINQISDHKNETQSDFKSSGPIKREFQGYIEYTSTFPTPKTQENLSIYLGKVGDADKVYVNNILIGQTGNFPPNYQYAMDVERNYLIPYSLLKKSGSNEVKVLVYSKYFVNKGFRTDIAEIGNITDLNHKKYTNEVWDNLSRIVVPLLCLILAAISFPLLAPKALWCEQLIISLIGISSFILGICRGRICFHYFDMLLTYKVTIMSSVTTLWLISYYAIGVTSIKRKITISLLAVVGLVFLILMGNQSDLLHAADVARFWFYVAPFFIFLGISFFFQRDTKNYLLEAGFIILFAADINDVLHDLKIINSTSMLQTGLGIFILFLILNQVVRLRKSWESFFKKELELDRDAILGRQAVQLAHDIRSPLEALKSSKDELAKLPELERESVNLAIRRIEDIAYNLLLMRKGKVKSTNLTHIKSTANQIIQEKKLQYRDHTHLSIQLSTDLNSYELFSALNPEIFKRVISNLLDNAIEASCYTGLIEVLLEPKMDSFKISIVDNGSGVPKDKRDRLFEKGFTTKPEGNGLGLYHAKKEIEQANGQIIITHSDKTSVEITLPKISPPKNFPLHIDLSAYSNVIVLDDDESIHQVWKKRFKQHSVTIEHFYKAQDLLAKYESIPASSLLLSDYELLGETISGLDCIIALQSNSNSILITARADEQNIIKTCNKHSIKILPKSMANEIEIKISQNQKNIVLIDDDKLTHYSWRIAAKNAGINFASFFSIDDFKKQSHQFSFDSVIYVDSDLGQDLRGEVLSKEIFDMGFKNLNMATGFSESDFHWPFWIKTIQGKRPPF